MKETTYLRLASVWCLVLRNSNSCWRRRRTERSANPWENVQCSMKTWTSSTVKPLAKTCTCLGNIINYSWGSVIVLLEQVEQGCQWSHTTPCSMLVHQVWFLKGEFPIIAPLYSHQFRTICARCFENILGSWKGLQVRFSSAVHFVVVPLIAKNEQNLYWISWAILKILAQIVANIEVAPTVKMTSCDVIEWRHDIGLTSNLSKMFVSLTSYSCPKD